MVAPLEEQMHQHLIEQEEKRCRALELEYKKKEMPGKTVKRKVIEKPWTRPGKHALCQDTDMLILVNAYDYDLSDKAFQEYCSVRGILHVAGELGSHRWEFFTNYEKSRSEYFKDRYFQFTQEVNGKRYRYTDEEMRTGWEIILLGRAKLQDCWELYSSNLNDKDK